MRPATGTQVLSLGLLGVAQIGEGVLQRDVLDAVEQIGRRAEICRVVARGNISSTACKIPMDLAAEL